jgi:hypothetical protein
MALLNTAYIGIRRELFKVAGRETSSALNANGIVDCFASRELIIKL